MHSCMRLEVPPASLDKVHSLAATALYTPEARMNMISSVFALDCWLSMSVLTGVSAALPAIKLPSPMLLLLLPPYPGSLAHQQPRLVNSLAG